VVHLTRSRQSLQGPILALALLALALPAVQAQPADADADAIFATSMATVEGLDTVRVECRTLID